MKYLLFSFLIFLSFINNSIAQTIDQENSAVHFAIGNMLVNTVEGSFRGFVGQLEYDGNSLESLVLDLCIDVKTVDTDNEERNAHLLNEDFFHVTKYPTICFKSQKVELKDSKYYLTGYLTILDKTKSISIPISIEKSLNSSILKAEMTLDRFDYGLAAESYSSSFMVGSQVDIRIEITLK